MAQNKTKKSIISRIRNYFLAGAVVLIPIAFTLYLTLFIIKVSSRILPKEINPNHYLPIDIPGIEILITFLIITLIIIFQKLKELAFQNIIKKKLQIISEFFKVEK